MRRSSRLSKPKDETAAAVESAVEEVVAGEASGSTGAQPGGGEGEGPAADATTTTDHVQQAVSLSGQTQVGPAVGGAAAASGAERQADASRGFGSATAGPAGAAVGDLPAGCEEHADAPASKPVQKKRKELTKKDGEQKVTTASNSAERKAAQAGAYASEESEEEDRVAKKTKQVAKPPAALPVPTPVSAPDASQLELHFNKLQAGAAAVGQAFPFYAAGLLQAGGADHVDSAPSTDVKGKRKVDEADADDELAPWADEEDEGDVGLALGGKKKKPKKELKKKVVSWKELSKPSIARFERFPNEIMSLVISVDSDLDLRDHLALAGTCRFMRACYTDVVWQILFYKHCPTLICDAREVNVFHSCSKSTWPSLHKPDQLASYVQHRAFDTSYRNQYHAKFLEGPFQRGLLPARHIFSSGTDGAPGAARWGATEDEWAADEPARKRLQHATKKAVLADPAQCARVYDRSRGKMAVADDVYADLVVFDDLTAAELQSYRFAARDAKAHEKLASNAPSKAPAFDPWPSAWRNVVSDVVNKPVLTKTDAKKFFKVTDRELLAIPLVKRGSDPWGPRKFPQYGGYRLATLQALALRAHGGPAGREQHKNKLADRSKQAAATRVKNGTVQRSKYSGFWGGLYGGGYGNDYYSDEDGYGHCG